MFQAYNNRPGHYMLLILVSLGAFFVNLGGPTLWEVDEGRNATAAYEMMLAGNWITPTYNGDLRVDKPALLYWLQIFAYQLFGVHEFSARLPSALAALLTVLLTYELGRSLFNAGAGLLSGLITATTMMVCAAGRFANPDALLNVAIVLTMFFFWRVLSRHGKYAFVGCGFAMGVAVLAKGPVGVVLPTAILGLFLLWSRRLHLLWHRRLLLSVFVFCLTCLPWYILVAAETRGHFLKGFIGKHNVNRFLSTMENHGGGPFYYLLVLVIGFAPWSIFLGITLRHSFASLFGNRRSTKHPALKPEAQAKALKPEAQAKALKPEAQAKALKPEAQAKVTRLPSFACASGFNRPVYFLLSVYLFFRSRLKKTADHEMDGDASVHVSPVDRYRFLWCWLGLYVLFFSLAATKLPNYVLPVTTPLALLTARTLQRWYRGAIHPHGAILTTGLLFYGLLGVLLSAGFLLASGVVPHSIKKMPNIDGLAPWALLGLAPIFGAGTAGWFLLRKQRLRVVQCIAVSVLIFLLPLLGWILPMFNSQKAPRPLVEQSDAQQFSHDIRIGCLDLQHLASLNFYCKRHIYHFDAEKDALAFLRYPVPVYLFVTEPRWKDMQAKAESGWRIVGVHTDLYRACKVFVVTNR